LSQQLPTTTAVVVTGAMAGDAYSNQLIAAAEEMTEAVMAMAVAMVTVTAIGNLQ
jgi:hypothetical protein